MPNKIENLAYLAGLIDGEGSFCLGMAKGRRHCLPIVNVANTNPKIINWLMQNFGGATRIHKIKDGKQWYTWVLRIEEQIKLLPQVEPFLVAKKKQAKFLLEYIRTTRNNKRGHKINEIEFQRRLGLKRKLQELNKQYSYKRLEYAL